MSDRPSTGAPAGEAALLPRLDGWRRRLHWAALARGALAGAGAGLALQALLRLLGASGAAWSVPTAVAAVGVATVAWWRAGVAGLSRARTALWLEEREPRLRYALVTLVEPVGSALVRVAAERTVRSLPWEAPSRLALWRSLRAPAAMALAGALLALLASGGAGPVAGGRAARPAAPDTSAPATIGPLTVVVRAPAYARLSDERFEDPAIVRAYVGSRLTVQGRGEARGTGVALDAQVLPVRAGTTGWYATLTMGPARALARVARGEGATRLVALEPRVDSTPVVTLRQPARDTVLRAPRGTFALEADVHDDLGLASATFEYIVTSGEGERFTFRSGTLGALPSTATRAGVLRSVLSLEALGLRPGDVVHVRAVARDRNDVTGPGVGTSESRAIRVARADEYDSLAVEQAPPSEVDQSVLSQRMLITQTEALVRRRGGMARADVVAESRRIGRDQARLRRQVSDILFARLGDGAGGGEHFHGDGHAHDESERLGGTTLTPAQLLEAAERATAITGSPTDFEHDETPVVAVNRPMLEAYNAMWEAGRELEGGEPARALPPMHRALEAIQRARAAERLYLRGTPPRVVVDLARVRLQGKERGTPDARRPRAALDGARAGLVGRFGRALDLLERSPAAAIDSLLVLRLAVVDRHPAAAAALERAIDALRSARDATDALLVARRALDDALVVRDALPAWGILR